MQESELGEFNLIDAIHIYVQLENRPTGLSSRYEIVVNLGTKEMQQIVYISCGSWFN